MERQLGAAHRRNLRRARQRALEAVCELGAILRKGAERPGGPRAVGGRWRDPRGLLRCGAHTADSRRRAGGAEPRDSAPRFGRAAPVRLRSGLEVHISRRNARGVRVRAVHEHERRRAVGAPSLRAHSRGRGHRADGRLLPAGAAGESVEYFITNPGPNTPVVPIEGFDISFEDAIHDYDAVEFTADKRFGNNWGLQSSYRWSRLHGTFEGFFRNDNGQSDPAITSLFDFPTNDPSYAAIGVPEFGFRGDIRYLGSRRRGSAADRSSASVQGVRQLLHELGTQPGCRGPTEFGYSADAMAANPS